MSELPVDADWTPVRVSWGVEPACCGEPAIGPASPEGEISTDGAWPADGFYDVTVTRASDPPGVFQLGIRPWLPCRQRPDLCPPDAPDNAVAADPATVVVRPTIISDELIVVIQPIQTKVDGRFPDPPAGITGTGSAFLRLLWGWCEGFLPPDLVINCGIDHAFIDWVWDPYQAGSSLAAINEEILSQGRDPAFPLGPFDDGSSEIPCSVDRACPIAYRGPRGTHFVIDTGLVETLDEFPGYRLYGWLTTLEIRDGRPILYVDAGQLAG